MKHTITKFNILLKVLHSQLTIRLSFLNNPWPGEQSVVPKKLQMR